MNLNSDEIKEDYDGRLKKIKVTSNKTLKQKQHKKIHRNVTNEASHCLQNIHYSNKGNFTPT